MTVTFLGVMHYSDFYPRPVLAFGYCRCLHLCVCVCLSVCLCVNREFVRTITGHPFKLESPNLEHRCKTPWLRPQLFLGVIDLNLQGQIELESRILPHFELVHMITCHLFRLVTKFGPKMHPSTGKIPIDLGVDRPWSSRSNLTLKSNFIPFWACL